MPSLSETATIVVGIDASARSEDAAAFARVLARATGAHLLPTTAREGAPAVELERIADEQAAALIVVGSSHRGALGRLFPGSTALRLAHGASCPVAVVPLGYATQPSRELARIGCAWLPSERGDAALHDAAALAAELDARLVVIHAFDTRASDARELAAPGGRVLNLADFERSAREDLEDAIAGLPPDVAAEPAFAEGAPDAVLAAESGQLDLLVAAARGQGTMRAVLLGGVTHQLLHTAACPVIVLPHDATRTLRDLVRP